MGLFSCCFSPAEEFQQKQCLTQAEPAPVAPAKQQAPAPAVVADTTDGTLPAAADSNWSKSWSKLNQSETTAVKQTLLKVGTAHSCCYTAVPPGLALSMPKCFPAIYNVVSCIKVLVDLSNIYGLVSKAAGRSKQRSMQDDSAV